MFTPNVKARLKRTAILCLIALGLGAAIGFAQIRMDARKSDKFGYDTSASIAGADIGGPYTLVNQDGETVTDQNFAGQHKLIYFGFTYCPAVCPTELQKIAQVMKTLEEQNPEIAAQFQPIFISIDPERDTPEVMQSYVEMFHPRLIGLSGSQIQINAIKKEYRIYAAKVQSEDNSDYTMDHSSFIYWMSPDDTLLGIYRAQDNAAKIAQEIVAKISQ